MTENNGPLPSAGPSRIYLNLPNHAPLPFFESGGPRTDGSPRTSMDMRMARAQSTPRVRPSEVSSRLMAKQLSMGVSSIDHRPLDPLATPHRMVGPSRHARRSSERLDRSLRGGTPYSSPGSGRTRKRLMLSSSTVLSPQLREMNLERKIQILVDIAGDCLIKLVRWGIDPSEGDLEREFRISWISLKSACASEVPLNACQSGSA